MDTTTSSSESHCKNPSCGRQLPPRASGGHRQREYCGDNCRQAARRVRLEGELRARSVEAVHSWGDFQPATVDLLAGLLAAGSGEYARRLASIIGEEQGGLAQLQERFRSYVETTNERVGNLCGELAKLRQERERSVKPKPLAKGERQELEQARADLLRLYQECARGSEEIHRLSELVYELQRRLGAAHHRITELESSKRGSQAESLCIDEHQQERAAGQEDQRTIEDSREKLLRAAQQVQKLEKQVEVQRQMIGQYHTRFYPSSLAVAREKFMALGAAINYRIRLKYDAQAVEVPSGEQAWREFAIHASYDELAQAILQAQHFFDNLFALGMVGKHDNQVISD